MSDQTSGDRPSVLTRMARFITVVEIGVAGLAAAMIFVLVLLQAGQRYLPIDGYTWTGELSRFGLVWLTFAAVGVLVTRDGHIALQVVDTIPNERVVRTIHVVSLLVVAATGAGFAWASQNLVAESGNLSSPALGLPMTWVYVIPMLGFASTAIRATIAAVVVARRGVEAGVHPDELAIQVNAPAVDNLTGGTRGEGR